MKEIHKRTLKYIKQCAKREGNPLQKSQQQLADEMNLSRSTIHNHLDAIEAEGSITRDISELQRPKIIIN